MTTPIITSITDSQMHNNIMAASSRDHSPMLAPGRYAQWKSFVPAIDDTLAVPERTTVETILNMSPEKKTLPIRKGSNSFAIYCCNDASHRSVPSTTSTRMYQKEVNEIHAERITKNANPLALVVAASQYPDTYYQAPKSHKSYAPPLKQASSTRSNAPTKHKGKEIAKPITPSSESTSEEDSDPEQAQRDKDMTVTVVGDRETIGSQVVQQSGIQCFNCKEFGHFAKECRKPKRVKDYTYHKEKMLLYKQAKKGVQLQAEKADLLEETDKEIDEQELEVHYGFMAKIQEVLPPESNSNAEPLEQVQYDAEYNVFANVKQNSGQPKSISNTCVVEKGDSNVIPDSPDIRDNDIQTDQNAEDERVALTNLIANLTLDTEENKKILKQLKKANASLTQDLKECKSNLEESNTTRDSCLIALQCKQTDLEKYMTFNDHTVDYDKLERSTLNGRPTFANLMYIKKAQSEKPCLYELPYDSFDIANRFTPDREETLTLEKEKLVDQAWEKHSYDHFHAPTTHDMEILIKTCLMPLALKTQNDSFTFVYELKQEMHADLKYAESLEKEIDELESDKAEYSNMYDLLLQVYLKAQLQDKSIAISELKKLIEKCKGKYVETKFDKPSVVQQPNAQRIPKPSVLGKPTPFSDSLERKIFSKTKSVPKTNVLEGLSKPITTQIFPQTARQAIRNTNVIKLDMYRINTRTTQTRAPQLPQTSKNTNPLVSTSTGVIHKTNSVTACNDSLKSKTLNVNAVCATCKKCMFYSNHDDCVSKFLNDVNTRTKKPKVVPISPRKPKSQAHKFVATPPKKTVASESTIQKSKSYYRMMYEKTSKAQKWWIEQKCSSGYKWVPKTKIKWVPKVRNENVQKRVSFPIDNASRITNIIQLILFIVDSGCTKHMTSNLKLLCNFVEKYLGIVRFGNDQFALILSYGDLVQGNIMINMFYYVEGLKQNLFSVGQFCDADLEVAFRKSTCFVRDLQGNDLLIGNHGSDLYTISLQETTSSAPIRFMAKASPSQAWLWHQRLSHLNFDYINSLSKKDVVIGLPKLKYVKDQLCSFYEVSKAKRSSFKTNAVPSSKGRLNLLHMHLCGPMRVTSINGKKYILLIVDDYSKYTWTLFLRSKDKTSEVLKDFLKMIQRNLQALVISVRTDRGTEFLNKTLNAFFKEEGIEHQTSTPQTPE
ncbi:retrovirus-related pol polyprotein from transposon TNT 1-94 [Tanacetum coccineum]